MSAIAQQALAVVGDNIAAIIEGTGGYTGVPGVYSIDEALIGTVPSALSFAATSVVGKVTIGLNTASYTATRWVKSETPGYWLLCTAATNVGNIGAARKVTAWTASTGVFTTAAFPANLTIGDTFYMLQGFKRVPEGLDIETSVDEGFDRFFDIRVTPKSSLDLYGAGNRSGICEVEIRLYLSKNCKTLDARRSAFENAIILRNAIGLRKHWEPTYTRAIIATSGETKIDVDTKQRLVVSITFDVLYRTSLTFN